MFKAMVWKELRNIRGILFLVLLVYFLAELYVSVDVGYILHIPFRNTSPHAGPFLSNLSKQYFRLFAVAIGIALGLWQTLGESVHGAWPFLLHRPVSRRWLVGAKLLVGLGSYFICGAAVIIVLGIWSARPRSYAAPFFWWMTLPWWEILLVTTVVYLAAFLVGFRPVRWHGTRLLPLVAVTAIVYVMALEPPVWWMSASYLGWPIIALLVDVALIRSIFCVARTRDYA